MLERLPAGLRNRIRSSLLVPDKAAPPQLLAPRTLPVGASSDVGSPPDFVGVGAPKAGTTWWFSLLNLHPDVDLNEDGQKELHFFDHLRTRRATADEVRAYRAAFRPGPGRKSGEWSPTYLTLPGCLENLRAAAPDTKVLVMLRNPVDRMLSHRRQIMAARRHFFCMNETQEYLFDLYSVSPEVLLYSLYSHSIRRLLRIFPRENVLVLQYERCASHAAEELARTYSFLGLEPHEVSGADLERRVNARPPEAAQLGEDDRRCLFDYFRQDVAELATLVPDLRLELWSDFQQG